MTADREGSKVVPLTRPIDALAARVHLIDEAHRTLDAQYYEWDVDAVGMLILERLIAAADRGVRVRMIVDDLKLRKSTAHIAAVARHPNFEVRLFNPWSTRSGMAAIAYETVRRFRLLDHRMHNKLLVADGERAIFGGRNLAEAFFGLSDSFNLIDFDALLASPAVTALEGVFDRYWQSPSAVNASRLRTRQHLSLDDARIRVQRHVDSERARLREVYRRLPEIPSFLHASAKPIDPGAVSVVSDAPTLTADADPSSVGHHVKAMVEGSVRNVVAITAFFDPTDADIDWYRSVVSGGRRLALVTNSLATNPGTVSNARLKKVRRALIDAGVDLYELRDPPACKPDWEISPISARRLGIHAKVYVADRRTSIVGSVNLDPRSKHLNTELGVRIDDPSFSADRADAIEHLMHPANAWRVVPEGESGVAWEADGAVVTRQPARNVAQRVADGVVGLLPVDRYL